MGTITKVSDGDTVHFVPDAAPRTLSTPFEILAGRRIGGTSGQNASKRSVRMVGIDTPELHLPYPGGVGSQGYWAEEAQRILAQIIPVGTRVELETYGIDSHGRTLGRVIEDGHDVHEDLIREGLAVTYQICQGRACNQDFYAKAKFERYRELCQDAVDAERGIYSPITGLDELPFEYRLRMQKRVPDKYVANFDTGELVEPANYAKVPICDRLFFPVLAEAEAMGYRLKPSGSVKGKGGN